MISTHHVLYHVYTMTSIFSTGWHDKYQYQYTMNILIVIYNTYMISILHVLYTCTQWPQYSLLIVIYNTYDKYTPCTVPCVHNQYSLLIVIYNTYMISIHHIWPSVQNMRSLCTHIQYMVYTYWLSYMHIHDKSLCTPCTVPCVHNDLNILYWLSSYKNIEVIVYTWYMTWCILIMYVLYMTISR